EGLRVAALAEQHAVMIAPHTAPELHAHLVAALPRCGFGVESHGDAARNPLSHHLLVGGPETRDGFVHLNDRPGFGVEIDWDYATRYAAWSGARGGYAGTAPPIVVRCTKRRWGMS